MKKQKSGVHVMFAAFFDSVLSSIKSKVVSTVIDSADNLFDTIEERVLLLQRKLMLKAAVTISIGLGVLALLFSLMFFLADVLRWQWYAILLIIAAILLIFALVISLLTRGR